MRFGYVILSLAHTSQLDGSDLVHRDKRSLVSCRKRFSIVIVMLSSARCVSREMYPR